MPAHHVDPERVRQTIAELKAMLPYFDEVAAQGQADAWWSLTGTVGRIVKGLGDAGFGVADQYSPVGKALNRVWGSVWAADDIIREKYLQGGGSLTSIAGGLAERPDVQAYSNLVKGLDKVMDGDLEGAGVSFSKALGSYTKYVSGKMADGVDLSDPGKWNPMDPLGLNADSTIGGEMAETLGRWGKVVSSVGSVAQGGKELYRSGEEISSTRELMDEIEGRRLSAKEQLEGRIAHLENLISPESPAFGEGAAAVTMPGAPAELEESASMSDEFTGRSAAEAAAEAERHAAEAERHSTAAAEASERAHESAQQAEQHAQAASEASDQTSTSAQNAAQQEQDAQEHARGAGQQEQEAQQHAQAAASSEQQATQHAQTAGQQEQEATQHAQGAGQQEQEASQHAQGAGQQEQETAAHAQAAAAQSAEASQHAQGAAQHATDAQAASQESSRHEGAARTALDETKTLHDEVERLKGEVERLHDEARAWQDLIDDLKNKADEGRQQTEEAARECAEQVSTAQSAAGSAEQAASEAASAAARANYFAG